MTTSLASREKVDLSVIENRAPSVARMFLDRVAATPASEAFRFASGDSWASVTWSQVGDRVRRQAAGLIALGVEREQPVAVASATRYEWVLADLAIMCAGAATTTVYPTTTAEDVTYIISDSGSRVVFAEDDAQIRKLRDNRGQLPDVAKVVTTDGTPDGDWVITLAELERLGEDLIAAQPSVVDDRVAATTPDSLATLIYTSGTTGRPKGVRLLHSAWTYEAASVDSVSILRADDLQYLWLPLSHVFGKVLLTLAVADRLSHRNRRTGRQDSRQSRRRAADIHGRRAAHLREGARPHRGARCTERAASKPRSSTGRSTWGSRSYEPGRPAIGRPPCSWRSTRLPIGWSSARSASDSADGCGSSSPDPPPSTATSRSGSMRLAS